jgi:hypothetical protein
MPAEAGISLFVIHEIPHITEIPAYAGMTAEVARMTEREHEIPAYAGMTAEVAGMTVVLGVTKRILSCIFVYFCVYL